MGEENADRKRNEDERASPSSCSESHASSATITALIISRSERIRFFNTYTNYNVS